MSNSLAPHVEYSSHHAGLYGSQSIHLIICVSDCQQIPTVVKVSKYPNDCVQSNKKRLKTCVYTHCLLTISNVETLSSPSGEEETVQKEDDKSGWRFHDEVSRSDTFMTISPRDSSLRRLAMSLRMRIGRDKGH